MDGYKLKNVNYDAKSKAYSFDLSFFGIKKSFSSSCKMSHIPVKKGSKGKSDAVDVVRFKSDSSLCLGSAKGFLISVPIAIVSFILLPLLLCAMLFKSVRHTLASVFEFIFCKEFSVPLKQLSFASKDAAKSAIKSVMQNDTNNVDVEILKILTHRDMTAKEIEALTMEVMVGMMAEGAKEAFGSINLSESDAMEAMNALGNDPSI